MKISAEEVEKYIQEVAKTVAADLLRRYHSLLESNISKLDKEHWFEVHPTALSNFKEQGIVLLSFGIEGIELDEMFRADANGRFRGYIFAHSRSEGQHQALFSALDTLFQS